MSALEPAAPDLGMVVPGWALRALFAVVAVALSIALAVPGFWLTVAVLLAGVAVAAPQWLTAWFLIGGLALSLTTHEQSFSDWRPYVLIAGAHALHILASWMLVVAPTAKVQPAVLWPSARRFLIIQLPVQALAVGALAVTTAVSGGDVLGLAVISGVAVLALVVALAALLVRPPRD
ncbi:hypothetical protein [Leifsonia sp. NPDC058230]|uniref:hypothetical protein n=1 Tax=Leifsonia sp. NPDC058230 TaxID=3346391 RepID=UPI0036DCA70E